MKLRPQKFDLKINVGDKENFTFDFWMRNEDVKISHSFPPNVDVKLFSSCAGLHSFKDISTSGCKKSYKIHPKINVEAQIELKSCSENAKDWKSQQWIKLVDDDGETFVSIDFTTFCSCSCDKPYSKEICRNDKKSFLEVNPCAEKNNCTECLRDASCNWCTSPSYFHVDGSPLPRCNSDNFFTADLCPEEGILNPSQALADNEICDNCQHCGGGVCSENKKDIMSGNTCVSQLTCGECTRIPECAWCPSLAKEGVPHCNLETSWVVTLPERHYIITENTSFLEWVTPKSNKDQYECKKDLVKDRFIVPNETREFYPNNGRSFNPNSFNYDYSIPLHMHTGRKYNFQLSWDLSNIEQAKKNFDAPRHREVKYSNDPKFKKLKLTIRGNQHISTLVTRNSGDYQQPYYHVENPDYRINKYLEEDWQPSIPPFDYTIDYQANRVICNVTLELTKCPEKPINDYVYVLLEKVAAMDRPLRGPYPLGIFALKIKTVCECECQESCSKDFEKRVPLCNGGDLSCGVCQHCTDGTFGEFCQCLSGTQPIKPIPSLEMGKKDDLVGKLPKHSDDEFSFDHAIIPLRVSPDSLQCNATYCKNTIIKNCDEEEDKDLWDVAKAYQMVAIFGDHPLKPGAELEFKFAYCKLGGYLKRSQFERRFGFGVPISEDSDYSTFGYVKQPTKLKLTKYWSDELYYWRSWVGWSEDEFKYIKEFRVEKKDRWSETWKQDIVHEEPFHLDLSSYFKLTVTDTGVVWSWANFSFTHTIDILAKDYYPIFLLHGCDDKQEFSSVKIISSKTGKNE